MLAADPLPSWREDFCWTHATGCCSQGCTEIYISISQKDVGQQWSLCHSLIHNGGRYHHMLFQQGRTLPLGDVISIPSGKTRSTLPHINERGRESFVWLYQTSLCRDLQQEILNSDPELNFPCICSLDTIHLVNSPFHFQLIFSKCKIQTGLFLWTLFTAFKKKRMKKKINLSHHWKSSFEQYCYKKVTFSTAVGNATTFSLWLKTVNTLYLTDEVSKTV